MAYNAIARKIKTNSVLRSKANMKNLERITLESGKRGGKPCIRGLRITVYDVLNWLALGQSEADILRDYPELEADDIRACLAFAAQREHHGALVRAA